MKRRFLLLLIILVISLLLVSGCGSEDTSNDIEVQENEDFGDSGGEDTIDSGNIQPPPFPEE